MAKSLIFLTGYRGSGKTAVAQLLAQRLGWSWSDADVVLEAKLGRTIRQAFAEQGEEKFRAKESDILAELVKGKNAVIATGGGVVLRPENRERLRTGFVVWLTSNAETLWQRMQQDATTAERRPPLAQGGLEETRDLLKKRELLYAQCADLVVDTTKMTPDAVAEAIANHAQLKRART